MLGLAAAVVIASTIWVEAPDERTDCELPVAIADAVEAMVPEATVRVGDLGGDGDLRLRVGEADDGVHVELLQGEADTVLLARTLAPQARCTALADAVALVVERFLSDIGWQPAAVAVPVAGPGPEPELGPVDEAEPERERGRERGATIGIEAGGRMVLALAPTQLGGAADLRVRRGMFDVEVEVGALAARAEQITVRGEPGNVDTSSLYLLAGAGVSRGRFRGAALGGAERVSASAAGETIFQRADQAGWQPIVRGDLEAAFAIGGGGLAVRVAAAVEWRPDPLEIMVEGAETVQRSVLGVQVGAGVGWRFR